jgi:hypothetical protein
VRYHILGIVHENKLQIKTFDAINQYLLNGLNIPRLEIELASADHVSVNTLASTKSVCLKQRVIY